MAKPPSYKEEQYFLQQNATRREELRRRAEEAAARLQTEHGIRAALGTDDAALAARIRELGFDADSARVFDMIPLVQVSWVDGTVQQSERAAIMAILDKRGIAPDSTASLLIESLLEERPSEAFLDESLIVLKSLVDRGSKTSDVVDLCVQIADASGGFFGFGNRVSDDERELIRAVASALGEAAVARFNAKLGSN